MFGLTAPIIEKNQSMDFSSVVAMIEYEACLRSKVEECTQYPMYKQTNENETAILLVLAHNLNNQTKFQRRQICVSTSTVNSL